MECLFRSVCHTALRVSRSMDFIHFGNLQGVSSCIVVRDHVGVLDLVRLWLTFGTRRLVAFAEADERTVRT